MLFSIVRECFQYDQYEEGKVSNSMTINDIRVGKQKRGENKQVGFKMLPIASKNNWWRGWDDWA